MFAVNFCVAETGPSQRARRRPARRCPVVAERTDRPTSDRSSTVAWAAAHARRARPESGAGPGRRARKLPGSFVRGPAARGWGRLYGKAGSPAAAGGAWAAGRGRKTTRAVRPLGAGRTIRKAIACRGAPRGVGWFVRRQNRPMPHLVIFGLARRGHGPCLSTRLLGLPQRRVAAVPTAEVSVLWLAPLPTCEVAASGCGLGSKRPAGRRRNGVPTAESKDRAAIQRVIRKGVFVSTSLNFKKYHLVPNLSNTFAKSC